MIPSTSGFLDQDFIIEEQPSKTYKMYFESSRVSGQTNGLDAVKQAIYKILHTERFEYIIYSWNYGVELADLFGQPISFVCPELKRRISEALLWDTRITSVDNFDFTAEKGKVTAVFNVSTIYGSVVADLEVEV